jgi:hypothetical protein
LPFVTQTGVTLSVSGRISLMGSSILRSFLISCTLLGILPFPCSPWGRLTICWIVSGSPWPELLTMSSGFTGLSE